MVLCYVVLLMFARWEQILHEMSWSCTRHSSRDRVLGMWTCLCLAIMVIMDNFYIVELVAQDAAFEQLHLATKQISKFVLSTLRVIPCKRYGRRLLNRVLFWIRN